MKFKSNKYIKLRIYIKIPRDVDESFYGRNYVINVYRLDTGKKIFSTTSAEILNNQLRVKPQSDPQ